MLCYNYNGLRFTERPMTYELSYEITINAFTVDLQTRV